MLRRYMVWIDASGATRLTFVNLSASGTGVQTQLMGDSNASVLNAVENTLTVYTPLSTAAVYPSVADAAILTFQDAGGNLADITLPAPVSSIFLADQVTVDSTMIAAIIAAVVGTVVTASGGLVTAYVAGTRQRSR